MDFIGYVAATLTTVAFFPQALKVYRTRRTEDISLLMFVMFTVGVGFWLWYGVLLESLPMVIANFVTLVLAGYVLWIKVGNERRKGR